MNVWEAIARYREATSGEIPAKFNRPYPLPNRAMIRAMTFGGERIITGGGGGKPVTTIQPKRSRIQRGISRPGVRGSVVTNGLKPIFVDETGDRIDMAEFKEPEAA